MLIVISCGFWADVTALANERLLLVVGGKSNGRVSAQAELLSLLGQGSPKEEQCYADPDHLPQGRSGMVGQVVNGGKLTKLFPPIN